VANGNGQSFGEAIFGLLQQIAKSLLEIVERRFGIVRAYIEDVRDNIRFEDSRVDVITFLALLDGPTGAVTIISPNAQGTARIHPEYLFACRRVHGLFNSPSTMSANIALLEATIREDGRGQDMLTTPINLAAVVPGTGHDRIEWETPYVFRDAAEIKVTFSLRPEAATLWEAQTANRIVGIVLVGDLVRKKILP
jgi:hypothetical protein